MNNNLRSVRESKGISITELANLTGLSRQAIYNIENIGSDTKQSTMIAISNALGEEVKNIFFDTIVNHE